MDGDSFYGVDSAQSGISRKGTFYCPWNGGDTFRTVSDLIALAGVPRVRERTRWTDVNPLTVEMPDGAEASGDFSVSRFNFSILELVIAFLGGYVIISALRGTGSLFTDEFIKEEKKASFKRIMRIMAIVCGLVLIASAVATVCFSYIDGINIVRYVCLGLAFVLLIGMAVINSLMTDKNKRDKAQQTARTGGPTNSSAAFEFDGSEPTLDEVLADIEKDKSSDKPEK